MTCPYCAADLGVSAPRFCPRCGRPQPTPAGAPPGSLRSDAPSDPSGSSPRRFALLLALLTVVAVVLGVTVALLLSSGDDGSRNAAGSGAASGAASATTDPASSTDGSTSASNTAPSTSAPSSTRPAVTDLRSAFRAATPVETLPYTGAHPNLQFASPSKNVSCLIVDEDGSNRVTCTIGRYDFDQPGRDCDEGAQVGIDDEGVPAYEGCSSQPFLAGDPVLPYGRSLRAGRVGCVVEQSAVSCLDVDTGHGFALSREAMTLVPPSSERVPATCPRSATLLTAWNLAHPTSATAVNQIACSGAWATAAVTVDGNAVAGLFRLTANRWRWLERAGPCTAGQVPDAIYSQACESS